MLHWTLLLPLNAPPHYDALLEAGWRCGRDDSGVRRCQNRVPLGGVSGQVEVVFCGAARPKPCLVTYRRHVVGRLAQDRVAAAWARAAEQELGLETQDWVPLAGREWMAAREGQEVVLRAPPYSDGGWSVLLAVGEEGVLQDVGWTVLSPAAVVQEGWGPDTACTGDPIARLELNLLVDYDEAMARFEAAEAELRRRYRAAHYGAPGAWLPMGHAPLQPRVTGLGAALTTVDEAEELRDKELVDLYGPIREILRSDSFQCYCEQRRLQPTEPALQLLLAEREGRSLPRALTVPVGPPPR